MHMFGLHGFRRPSTDCAFGWVPLGRVGGRYQSLVRVWENTVKNGKVNAMRAPTLRWRPPGVCFILWLGWVSALTVVSQTSSMGTIGDIPICGPRHSRQPPNMASRRRCRLTALILTQLVLAKAAPERMVLNGALAGLVSITAESAGRPHAGRSR